MASITNFFRTSGDISWVYPIKMGRTPMISIATKRGMKESKKDSIVMESL